MNYISINVNMSLETEMQTITVITITREPLDFAVELTFNQIRAPGLRYVTFLTVIGILIFGVGVIKPWGCQTFVP